MNEPESLGPVVMGTNWYESWSQGHWGQAWQIVGQAFLDMGMTLAEAADALNQIAGLDFDPEDESHGMTLDELIPETIAEWHRIREDTPR